MRGVEQTLHPRLSTAQQGLRLQSFIDYIKSIRISVIFQSRREMKTRNEGKVATTLLLFYMPITHDYVPIYTNIPDVNN